MIPIEPTIDASFREYAGLQLRRSTLLTEGREQGPEFDTIEDRLTELWDRMDAAQRQSLNGMGSDLNSIRRNGQLAPKSRKAEEVSAAEQQELLTARRSKQWHAFLHYLRVCAPTIPAADLAYLRGEAYDAIGFPGYASRFHALATDLEPAKASMGLAEPFPGAK